MGVVVGLGSCTNSLALRRVACACRKGLNVRSGDIKREREKAKGGDADHRDSAPPDDEAAVAITLDGGWGFDLA